jgi:REP element-mobilizing transposase RayT
MRIEEGLPSLRTPQVLAIVRGAFRAQRGRFKFRIVEFAVLSNHVHMIVEAKDAEELSAAMKGLLVRIAKALNKHWDRAGKVWEDRYWSRVVRKVHELRRLIRYVLQNARRHGVRLPNDRPDPYSSGPWFDQWAGHQGQTFSREPAPTERPNRMELEHARRSMLELTDNPLDFRRRWVAEVARADLQ